MYAVQRFIAPRWVINIDGMQVAHLHASLDMGNMMPANEDGNQVHGDESPDGIHVVPTPMGDTPMEGSLRR